MPTKGAVVHLIPRSSQVRFAVHEFLVDREARQLSPRSVGFYRAELDYFLADTPATDISDLTPTAIRAYLSRLAGHRNPGGCSAAFRAIRAFMRWYAEEYDAPDVAAAIAKVRAPKVRSEPLEPVSMADLRKMIAGSNVRDKAILMALLDTGARAAEFIAMNIEDLDLRSGAILILHGKGAKRRIVFLGKKALRATLRYLRVRPDAPSSAPLWATDEGGRMTYTGLRMLVKRRAIAAGVSVPALHSFRRAFALVSLRAGMDVYSLQRLMGHADLSMLRRYLAQTQQDLAEAHARAAPTDRL